MAKLPATDPARRIGSLFVNPGGPGGSGVDFVRLAGELLLSPEVRVRFDLVGFDPAASAGARRCGATKPKNSATALLSPFPDPEQDGPRAAELYR